MWNSDKIRIIERIRGIVIVFIRIFWDYCVNYDNKSYDDWFYFLME